MQKLINSPNFMMLMKKEKKILSVKWCVHGCEKEKGKNESS